MNRQASELKKKKENLSEITDAFVLKVSHSLVTLGQERAGNLQCRRGADRMEELIITSWAWSPCSREGVAPEAELGGRAPTQ